jgi:pyruvate/2-oxoglutarate dehydrogenase complex dihydrolipoamide dehydrogenase (E3) component
MAYRLAKIPMVSVLRTRTLSETRGFLKALIDTESDRILGFTALGVEAGEIICDRPGRDACRTALYRFA